MNNEEIVGPKKNNLDSLSDVSNFSTAASNITWGFRRRGPGLPYQPSDVSASVAIDPLGGLELNGLNQLKIKEDNTTTGESGLDLSADGTLITKIPDLKIDGGLEYIANLTVEELSIKLNDQGVIGQSGLVLSNDGLLALPTIFTYVFCVQGPLTTGSYPFSTGDRERDSLQSYVLPYEAEVLAATVMCIDASGDAVFNTMPCSLVVDKVITTISVTKVLTDIAGSVIYNPRPVLAAQSRVGLVCQTTESSANFTTLTFYFRPFITNVPALNSWNFVTGGFNTTVPLSITSAPLSSAPAAAATTTSWASSNVNPNSINFNIIENILST